MKAKSLLAIAAVVAAGSAFASVNTANTLCRIHVASNLKSTIVAVPLMTVDGEETTISPENLVLTENLQSGDSILHWNSTAKKWDAWVLNGSSAWERASSVNDFNDVSQPVEGTALANGDAIWVNRPGAERTLSDGFYIYGQVPTTQTTNWTTAEGTTANPVFTLIGNTALADKKLKEFTISNPHKGDRIKWGVHNNSVGSVEFEYNGREWGCYEQDPTAEQTITIGGVPYTIGGTVWKNLNSVSDEKQIVPAGQGFWYSATGSGTTLSL